MVSQTVCHITRTIGFGVLKEVEQYLVSVQVYNGSVFQYGSCLG